MPFPQQPGLTILSGTVTKSDSVLGANYVVAETNPLLVGFSQVGDNTATTVGVYPTDTPALEAADTTAPVDNPCFGPGHPDYAATLPKPAPGPYRLINLTLNRAIVTINGVDYSNEFERSAGRFHLSRESEGTIELLELPSRSLNPDFNSDFALGNLCTIQAVFGDGGTINEFRNFYIVEHPNYVPNEIGGKLTLAIGDEFINQRRSRNSLKNPYCGPEPKRAGVAASLHMRLRTNKRFSFPRGVRLLEPVQEIEEEASFEFVSTLMRASGHLVRTDQNNQIQVARRPSFNANQAVDLYPWMLLQAPEYIYEGLVAYTTVTGRAQTMRRENFKFEVIKDSPPISGYNELDQTPWFLGGRHQRIDRTRHLLNGKVIYEKRESFGRVPTGTTYTKDTPQASQPRACEILTSPSDVWNDTNTNFERYEIYEFDTARVATGNGRQRITRTTETTDGVRFFDDGSQWNRFPTSGFDRLAEKEEVWNAVRYPHPDICPKDYNWLLTKQTETRREVLDQNSGLQTTYSKTLSYFAKGNQNVAAGIAAGQNIQWQEKEELLEYNRDTNTLEPQQVVIRDTQVPDAPTIDRQRVPVKIAKFEYSIQQISDELGYAQEADPVNAPYVTNDAEMRLFLEAWLRERAGAFGWVVVRVGHEVSLGIGDSVRLWDDKVNQFKPYIVDRMDRVLENGGLTVTYRLSREYV